MMKLNNINSEIQKKLNEIMIQKDELSQTNEKYMNENDNLQNKIDKLNEIIIQKDDVISEYQKKDKIIEDLNEENKNMKKKNIELNDELEILKKHLETENNSDNMNKKLESITSQEIEGDNDDSMKNLWN